MAEQILREPSFVHQIANRWEHHNLPAFTSIRSFQRLRERLHRRRGSLHAHAHTKRYRPTPDPGSKACLVRTVNHISPSAVQDDSAISRCWTEDFDRCAHRLEINVRTHATGLRRTCVHVPSSRRPPRSVHQPPRLGKGPPRPTGHLPSPALAVCAQTFADMHKLLTTSGRTPASGTRDGKKHNRATSCDLVVAQMNLLNRLDCVRSQVRNSLC